MSKARAGWRVGCRGAGRHRSSATARATPRGRGGRCAHNGGSSWSRSDLRRGGSWSRRACSVLVPVTNLFECPQLGDLEAWRRQDPRSWPYRRVRRVRRARAGCCHRSRAVLDRAVPVDDGADAIGGDTEFEGGDSPCMRRARVTRELNRPHNPTDCACGAFRVFTSGTVQRRRRRWRECLSRLRCWVSARWAMGWRPAVARRHSDDRLEPRAGSDPRPRRPRRGSRQHCGRCGAAIGDRRHDGDRRRRRHVHCPRSGHAWRSRAGRDLGADEHDRDRGYRARHGPRRTGTS